MIFKCAKSYLQIVGCIGKGAFAKVYLANDLSTNQKYAVKKLETSKMDQKQLELFKTEKRILRFASGNNLKNIIKLKDILKDASSGIYFIILEYCNGGSLQSCLYNYYKKYRKPFPENYVRYLMREILLGVKSLHDYGIIHRDLKLENILVKYKSEVNRINYNLLSAEVKITDFNTSYFPNKYKPKTGLGTVHYMAPSVLKNYIQMDNKSYDEKVDIWSLGTLCYEMLFAKKLFPAENNIYQNIINAKFYIEKTISPQARSFLYCMLQKKGINRPTTAQLLNHEFIRGNDDLISINTLTNSVPDYNKAFQKLKKTLLTKIIIFKGENFKHIITVIASEQTTFYNLIKSFFYMIKRPDLIFDCDKKVKFKYKERFFTVRENANKSIKELNLLDYDKIHVMLL